jgi:hypothetical protein
MKQQNLPKQESVFDGNASYITLIFLFLSFLARPAMAIDEASTIKALRLSASITGGTMPTSDPVFAQMVAQVQAGNLKGAATLAAESKYFTNYLAKRLAFQMQSPALDETIALDTDGTAFLIAHFTGAGGNPPSLSTIWSENQTYLVNVPINGVMTPTHINEVNTLTAKAISPSSIDWSTQIVQGGPQQAIDGSNFTYVPVFYQYVPIPAKHIGGYMTTSTATWNQAFPRVDTSIAAYGAYLGTNLRMVEAMWEIATGLSLVDFEDTTFSTQSLAQAQAVPRFVPENNPNFHVGQRQAACIACHGGGLSALAHGYSAFADVFDYDQNYGFVYNNPATSKTISRKSLGSNNLNRSKVLACDLVKTPSLACNADSAGPDPNQGWDLSSWQSTGILQTMGWTGPIKGQGLNQLGVALGRASIVYEFFTKRIVNEICPVGMFTATDISNIAAAVNPYAVPVPGTDDIRTIVEMVAINPTCL